MANFCGIAAWDPAVERCDLSEDGKQRTILFFGGIGRVVSVLEDWDNSNRSFTWTSSSALSPVSNYRAIASVSADGQASVLKLTVSYEARGISDEDARKTIDGGIHRGLCLSSPLRCTDDQRSIPPVRLIVYPNAYHGFDLSNLKVPVTYFGHHLEYNKEVTDQASETLREFLKSTVQDTR